MKKGLQLCVAGPFTSYDELFTSGACQELQCLDQFGNRLE